MAQLVKHLKVSSIADGPDPNQVNPSDWNASHVFSGGALGGLLMRDSGDATYGASWLASVAAGSVLISNGVGAVPTWASSFTLGGNLAVGGLLGVTGFGTHSFTAAGTGTNSLALRNSVAGPTNKSEFALGNDTNAALLDIVSYSSTYTASLSFDVPNGSVLYQAGAGGLSLVAAGAAASLRFYSGGAVERMRLASDGTVLINALSSQGGGKLYIAADSAANVAIALQSTNPANALAYLFFINSAVAGCGSIAQTGASTVVYNTSSDRRLKDDRGRATDLSALRAVAVHDFAWKADGLADRGVFAQDAHALYPRAVTQGDDDLTESGALAHPWMTDYSKFVADLIVGWQYHEQRLDALETALAGR
jgi:hypothetical protein